MAVEFERREGSMKFLIDFVVRNLAILAFNSLLCLLMYTMIDSAVNWNIQGFYCYTLLVYGTSKTVEE